MGLVILWIIAAIVCQVLYQMVMGTFVKIGMGVIVEPVYVILMIVMHIYLFWTIALGK